MTEPFRVRFAPGVMPGKWVRTWHARTPDAPFESGPVEEAEQVEVLRSGAADMCFVRLPVNPAGLHVIPLYEEVTVVATAKDHPVAAFDEVDVADLAGEHLLQDPDDVPQWRDLADEVRDGTRVAVPAMTVPQALEVVASGAGVLVLPMSVARLHHRKDVVHRPVSDLPGSRIGLAWLSQNEDPRVETFIGIVRGRTEQSSRATGAPAAATEARAGKDGRGTKGAQGGKGAGGAKGGGGAPHPRAAKGAGSGKAGRGTRGSSGGRRGAPRGRSR
ncbi:LysR family substrate-binding domain-containing protein [Georgenia wangjunii]|uniref:LysR family substrate-binding domain-containing protein n=1 Tax=Georgenia wangjunii TaxID=3117730 RepID=UPI002F2635D9